MLRQGVLGIKVKIMLPWDPMGKIGPKKPLPDHVSIVEPKDEVIPSQPTSEQKVGKPDQPTTPGSVAPAGQMVGALPGQPAPPAAAPQPQLGM
ncbi:small ribosomal subunit protein uS3A-like [Glandiceps talaboti]